MSKAVALIERGATRLHEFLIATPDFLDLKALPVLFRHKPYSFFITSNSTLDFPNFFGRFSSIFRLFRSDLGGKTHKISRKQLKHTTNDKFWAFKNSFLIENPNQRFQSESIMKSRTKSRLVHERDKVRNSNMATMLHWEHRYLAFLRLNLTRFIGLNFPF